MVTQVRLFCLQCLLQCNEYWNWCAAVQPFCTCDTCEYCLQIG